MSWLLRVSQPFWGVKTLVFNFHDEASINFAYRLGMITGMKVVLCCNFA